MNKKYTRAQVVASGGVLRCIECLNATVTILKADVNEEGQAFLYCEKCWEEFYDEKFDGTRLSSLNGKMVQW